MSPGAASRALDLLARAEKASRELGRDASGEALHDFRVALRRLRVHLKAARGIADVPKDARRGLKVLLGRTNSLRDAQIERDWLARAGAELTPLAAVIARRRRPSEPGDLRRRFEKVRARLKRALRRADDEPDAFSASAEAAGRALFKRLSRRVRRLERGVSARRLHELRIGVKRLRYLIEPIGARKGLPSLADCRRLQSFLGDLHDRDVIAADVEAARRERPSLAPLAVKALERLKREKESLGLRARREWSRPVWAGPASRL